MTCTPQAARAIVAPLESPCRVEQAVVSFGGATCPVILESTRAGPAHARWSVFAADPVEVIECRIAEVADPIEALRRRTDALPGLATHQAPGMPFRGGWLGYLGYEAGLGIEGLTPTTRIDVDIPDARFGLYDAAALFNHDEGRWYAVAVEWPAGSMPDRPPAADRIDALRRRLTGADTVCEPVPRDRPAPDDEAFELTPNMSHDEYLARVARSKEHIAAGDIYQVNLTTRFSARRRGSPLDLYRRLRAVNPASHAALISWGDSAVISASPELFLDLRAGHVITRPIKGTRPRGDSSVEDEQARRALLASEKDAAELNMIVDLLRNDLGRVCAFGSVRVIEPVRIETHPTVFHRVATIEGRLAEGMGWADLLRATFPGGSITGAPKIRAMQIIGQLEPTRRTAYCGAIGHVGLDGDLSLNVAIRTMVQVGDAVHVHAGGAIVADSDADDEYRELLAKARGMFRALDDRPPVIVEPNARPAECAGGVPPERSTPGSLHAQAEYRQSMPPQGPLREGADAEVARASRPAGQS